MTIFDSSINSLWHLHDAFTVQQAAALIAGHEPGMVIYGEDKLPFWFENRSGLTDACEINDVVTAFAALVNAIKQGTLKAKIVRQVIDKGWSDNDFEDGVNFTLANDQHLRQVYVIKEPNWSESIIDREVLLAWLTKRGVRTGFFFPTVTTTTGPDYLNQDHPRFSPGLAASVKAWLAMEDENLLRGKNPKQAMISWMESRYKELGLSHERDTPKNGTVVGGMKTTVIENAATLANWSKGGPPNTPGN